MAFQRSYSKVWWGSDNHQLPMMSIANGGNSDTIGFSSNSGYYLQPSSHLTEYQKQQQQQQQQRQQQQQQQQQHNYHQFGASGSGVGYHSLDYNNFKTYTANLSRISEVDDEQNTSKLSQWEKRDSPGSLRSQDSGFSDNDESHSTRSLSSRLSKTNSPSSIKSAVAGAAAVALAADSDVSSPTPSIRSSSSTVATPPTVIRRVAKSEFYSPLVSVSRRISFSGSPVSMTRSTAVREQQQHHYQEAAIEVGGISGELLMAQLDDMQLLQNNDDDVGATVGGNNKQKRRRRVTRSATKPLNATKRRTLLDTREFDEETIEDDYHDNDNDDDDGVRRKNDESTPNNTSSKVPEYNNETVYLGEASKSSYNNETIILGSPNGGENTNNNSLNWGEDLIATIRARHQRGYTASTSTPKAVAKQNRQSLFLNSYSIEDYENPLLNGHTPALRAWLSDLRTSYDHEVMSTLQTKSISQEAFKNLTITTNTVAKLIRQLQQRAMYLQTDFERIERILSGDITASLHDAILSAEQLIANVVEFSKVLERRAIFFTDARIDRRRFEDNLEQIRLLTKDTQYSLEHQHYINLESLLDDLQVLRRYLLIIIRLVFEKMVHVIVESIENSQCDLMLRANINMISTLSNIDYEGFASLTDAFVQNEAVRALLIVCIENKLSSVRALALRALATICCAPAAIAQLGSCGGVEIIRDILQVYVGSSGNTSKKAESLKRSDAERREAVSLLTQITAAWHGPEHRVDGLKDSIEAIVEGLTQLVGQTTCGQSLLLCAAALNNLSRIEATSHYSIMSNEAIFRLIEAVAKKEQQDQNWVSIFLYEQIVTMLHNMSLNKKCHHHLANGSIINFITSTYQTEFYKTYNSRAESDAQRRCIKAILHTLTRLVHDSTLGLELLEQQQCLPVFFKLAGLVGGGGAGGGGDQVIHDNNGRDMRDISQLAKQIMLAQQKEQQKLQAFLGQDDGSTNTGTELESLSSESELEKAATNNNTDSSTAKRTRMRFNLSRQESYV